MKRIVLIIIGIFLAILLTANLSAQKMNIKMKGGLIKDFNLKKIDSISFAKPPSEASLNVPDSVFGGFVKCKEQLCEFLVVIANAGRADLLITHVELSGDTSFSPAEPMPTVIQLVSNETYSFKFKFFPKSEGIHNSELRITSNSSKGLITKIKLTGVMECNDFQVNNPDINLGIVCPNAVIDKNVIIKNKASYDAVLNIATNNLKCSFSEILVKGNDSVSLPITVESSNVAGSYFGNIQMTDACQNEYLAVVEWSVEKLSLQLPEKIEMSASIGETDTVEIVVKNLSPSGIVKLNEIVYPNSMLSLLEQQLPMMIECGNEIKLKIIYKPLTSNEVNGDVILMFQPCDIERKIKFKGTPGKIVYIFKDNFEDYPLGEFPYSGGWILKEYNNVDTLPYVTDKAAVEGSKSLFGWGYFGPPASKVCYIRAPIKELPEEIYAECSIMINQVGFCGMGFMKMSGEYPITPMYVEFSNHGHFYYGICNEEYRWDNDGYGMRIWYKIKIRYNKVLKRFTIWVNDEQVAEKTCATLPENPFDEFYLSTGGGHHFEGSSYYDNVKIWYERK